MLFLPQQESPRTAQELYLLHRPWRRCSRLPQRPYLARATLDMPYHCQGLCPQACFSRFTAICATCNQRKYNCFHARRPRSYHSTAMLEFFRRISQSLLDRRSDLRNSHTTNQKVAHCQKGESSSGFGMALHQPQGIHRTWHHHQQRYSSTITRGRHSYVNYREYFSVGRR